MQFEEELARVLPQDLPNRERLISLGGKHLQMISVANEYMNLTRIVSPQEAAIKHVFDCVAPWRFFESSARVLDVGTGAGFPGIPLAIILPQVRFTLAESIGKKARFVESVIDALDLSNAAVIADRAESASATQRADVITARAVAPIDRLITLFQKPLNAGIRLLLFKGPDVETEMAEGKMGRIRGQVLCRYDLPEGFGSRALVELKLRGAERAMLRKQARANRQ
ncbi:MAG: 16S rRNA (guanine(527)-N(7))-methyltransferase RsmG [Bryobacteraceae bacterium]